MYIKGFDEFLNESIMGSISKLFGKGEKDSVNKDSLNNASGNLIWDFDHPRTGDDVTIEYSKSGSLSNISGDIGRIESSIGAIGDSFSSISKPLYNKVKGSRIELEEASAGKIPVVLSFPENMNMRSAYAMYSNFTKFPKINRNYDRTEFYVGRDDISTWLNYFINGYETVGVYDRENYKANPLEIKGYSFKKVDIYSLVNRLAEEDVIKLKKEESIDLISSLPPVYHQFLSFSIDATEKICKDLGVVFLIGSESGIGRETSEIDLNDGKLVDLLNEEFKKNPCSTIGELARLHLKLASEYQG